MSTSDKEVEKQLLEAGEKLLDPPSSLEELLSLLDKANQCLSEVEQSPPDSMQKALSPLMKALVAAKLFKHSDEDVKVAVAACISEITRITAPDAPYNDDQMKEVFQLIVSTFEHLVDESSRSYSKRTSILETVAKVRSCVVMLDLECDALIIEMFRHFLKAIRDHHSESGVYTSMETIMNLVLEESEDISPEMLSPILEYVRKDDEVPQISRRLAEQVLSSCASKLKTYLTEAVKRSGVSLDKYSNVVTSICEGTFNALQQDQVIANEKEDNQGHLTGEAHVEDTQKAVEISTPEQTDAPKDESGKSGVSNGVAQIAQNDSPVNTDSTMKQDDTNDNNEPQQPDSLSNTDLDNTTDEKTGVELNIEKTVNQPSSVELVDSSKTPVMKEEADTGVPVDNTKDVLSSPPHDSSVNADASSENEKKTSLQALPSKTSADETTNVSSPSRAQDLHEESRSKKVVNQKKKENSEKEPKPSASSASKEVSEEPNTSEAKLTKKSGKKATSSSKAKAKRKEEKKSTSETKAKQSGKKAVESDNVQECSKPKEEKNKPERGKGKDEESLHTSSGDNEKPAVSSGKSASKAKKDVKQPLEETPTTNTKRKRSLPKGKASDLKRHDENLVGSRIKVWWPMDRAYYNGVVDSYDSTKNRHLVCYDDGDQEILNLKKQKWYFLEELESSQDEEAGQTGHDEEASTTPQKKKAKTDKEQPVNKQSKTNSSSKKGSGAGSSKSKAASASKSSKKSEDYKTDSKPKDSKEANKEKEDSSEEFSDEEETPKPVTKPATTKSGSSKSKKDVPKSGKSKEQGESSTPKAPPSKKKEETSSSKPKSGSAKSSSTKGKTGKASGKSNLNNNKAKTGAASTPSSKAKESDLESDTEETPKVPETTTTTTKGGKSSGTSKSQSKSGKKRKR